MNISYNLFLFFSVLSVISGLMVIISKNAVHSILFLILVFFNVSGILLLLDFEFLAIIFLIIYVGAIAVLFLFVVMMLNIRVLELTESFFRYLPISLIIMIIFFFEIFYLNSSFSNISLNYSNLQFSDWSNFLNFLENIKVLSSILFVFDFYLFILSGLILLLALVSAIALTYTFSYSNKRQLIYKQMFRDISKTIKLQ